MPVSLTPHPLQNWIPYKIIVAKETATCHWLYVGNKTFTEPFFDETISKCKSLPFNSKGLAVTSNLEFLTNAASNLETVAPTAFIFHVSRCGSTLLSQLLGLNKKNIVLAEVPVFDQILQIPYKTATITMEAVENALSASIRLLSQKRTGEETSLFIKLDSWHFFFYDAIRKLYPEVPIILLYRTPEEVVHSHQKLRGMQAVPGVIDPRVLGFSLAETKQLSLDAYTIKVLEKFFQAIIRISLRDKKCLLLNYHQGVSAMMQQLTDFTGIELNPQMQEKVTQRSRFHSK